MKRVGRVIVYFALILVAVLTFSAFWNYSAIRNLTRVVPSFYAKEMCSCLFVVNQTQDYCHEYSSQVLPVSEADVDTQKRTVTARAYGWTFRGVYQNQRMGCKLEELTSVTTSQ